MSVGRRWVRRLGLLLAAGVVLVQVPALGGIGPSGASAAQGGTPKHATPTPTPTNTPPPVPTNTPTPTPTPSYSVNLAINSSTCVATVTTTWSALSVNAVDLSVTDLTNTSAQADTLVSVSGTSGTVSSTFQLNTLPLGTVTNTVDPHSFNASASFNGGQAGVTTTYTVNAPCYLGTLH